MAPELEDGQTWKAKRISAVELARRLPPGPPEAERPALPPREPGLGGHVEPSGIGLPERLDGLHERRLQRPEGPPLGERSRQGGLVSRLDAGVAGPREQPRPSPILGRRPRSGPGSIRTSGWTRSGSLRTARIRMVHAILRIRPAVSYSVRGCRPRVPPGRPGRRRLSAWKRSYCSTWVTAFASRAVPPPPRLAYAARWASWPYINVEGARRDFLWPEPPPPPARRAGLP